MWRNSRVKAVREQTKELYDKRNAPGKEVNTDGKNCPCPRCGVLNFHPAQGIRVPRKGEEKPFERMCDNCRKPILYIMWWEQESGSWILRMKAKAYQLTFVRNGGLL